MTHVMIHTDHHMTTVITVQAPSPPPASSSDVTLRKATASDTEALVNMLSRCSRTTLFHRFHGLTDGVAYFGTLLRNASDDQTLLAWRRSTCVGVATLAAGATGMVDLGVLIVDRWQRQGIGTQVVASLLASVRATGVSTVHADVLGEDLYILEALRRIGPLMVAIEFGSYSVDVDISSEPRSPIRLGLPLGSGETRLNRGAT